MEHTFNEANFEAEVVQSSAPVFIDFWAAWCGPCQMMGPIVESLAHEMDSGKVKIGKVNVDENAAIAGKFQVLSIPTFIMVKNGVEVDRTVGGMTKEKLQAFIEKNLA
jgi:thioredoxin 1